MKTTARILSILSLATAIIAPSVAISANPKPFTVPEIREWKGSEGSFEFGPGSRITYVSPRLADIALDLSDQWKVQTGESLPVAIGKGKKGDVVLTLSKDRKLGAEGYRMKVGDKIEITAATPEGIRWAGKTLLQMRESSAALPKGDMTDWPEYGFRGFMIDAGRKFMPLEYLYVLTDVMSHRKMNVLHVHLNDNAFPEYFNNDWGQVPTGFRMESETFPGLASRDGYYTKQEFRDFQKYAASKGVEIIPEFDFPAHSLAFTQYKPEIGSKNKYNDPDHLDLDAPETYEFLDALLEEYLGGENPVFTGPRFHIGTDEYKGDSILMEKFRALTDRYIRKTEEYGKQPAVWGSLTYAKGETPVKHEGVLMYGWSKDYADPVAMLAEGYDMVSIPDWYTYIVPAAGYYYDYLDTDWLYNNWTPVNFSNVVAGEGNPKLKGGMFAVWNDHPNNGITVKDIHHRVMDALPVMAAKTWSGSNVTVPSAEFLENSSAMGEAPGVEYLGKRAYPGKTLYSAASVAPGSETGIREVAYPYVVEFDLDGEAEVKGTPLFESPDATFWLSDPLSGMMGYSREGKLVTFRHDVRPGEKSRIRIEGDYQGTKFYVDGKLIDNHDLRWSKYPKGKGFKSLADVRTLVFPLQKAGDFKSRVGNLEITGNDSAPQPHKKNK